MSALAGCSETPQVEPGVDVFMKAQEAIQAGNKPEAMKLLNQSIEAQPTFYAYAARGRLYLEMGNAQSAMADCQKGLELEPEDRDLKWLMSQIKLPAARRFQGAAAAPPSSSK
ncbi:MAG: hypothetical protein U9N87_06415 [Planctomycetota bacterium]|nr:hypothetical protein [Planctomycetota bacterium]